MNDNSFCSYLLPDLWTGESTPVDKSVEPVAEDTVVADVLQLHVPVPDGWLLIGAGSLLSLFIGQGYLFVKNRLTAD